MERFDASQAMQLIERHHVNFGFLVPTMMIRMLRLPDVPLRLRHDDTFYAVLGYLVGQLAQDRIPVIDGLDYTPSEDQLKAFGAAAASSGAVALFHLVGVTPEAPTVDVAFQGRAPAQVIQLTMEQLREAWRALSVPLAPSSSTCQCSGYRNVTR